MGMGCEGVWMVTFDIDGGRVAAGFHHAAEEDGDVGYVALLEDGRILYVDISLCRCTHNRGHSRSKRFAYSLLMHAGSTQSLTLIQ